MIATALDCALDMARRSRDRLRRRLIVVLGTTLVTYVTTTREIDRDPASAAPSVPRAAQIHEYELHAGNVRAVGPERPKRAIFAMSD